MITVNFHETEATADMPATPTQGLGFSLRSIRLAASSWMCQGPLTLSHIPELSIAQHILGGRRSPAFEQEAPHGPVVHCSLICTGVICTICAHQLPPRICKAAATTSSPAPPVVHSIQDPNRQLGQQAALCLLL